jgi:hypothetical protein
MFDPHQRARFLVEEARIAGITPQDSLWLRHHTTDCMECARYEESVEGILRGLNSFAFEFDPAVGERMQGAVLAYARRPSPAWRWVLAAAVLLLLAAVPVYRGMSQAQREKADTLLMEEVESRVRRVIPVAMEPLIQSQQEESQ